LRALLSRYLYQSPEKIKFAKTGHGKPYLPEHPELVFNLSHTENFMVIAVAINCHLGIDIEYYQHKDSLGSIINRYFASEEINYWNKQPEEFKTLEFYRLWTRKEAFLKATGLGIAHGLSSSIINPEKPDSMLSVPDGCGQITDWQLMAVDLGESIACSLAVDKTVSRVNLHSF
jgi:4'-phosphopantetheinyl transferase